MPELPDVETFRRVLARHAVDRPIRRVEVADPGVLRDVGTRRLRTVLRGRRFEQPRRHGKWLVAPTVDGPVLVLHFGMTGSLRWATDGEDRHRHDRVVLTFDEGELRYRDMRKLQGVRLVADEAALDRLLSGLGPDALDVSREEFVETVGGLRRTVKTALVDQELVAGLGNLLADEILWRARVHPRCSCARLGRRELGGLHTAMGAVLRQAVKDGRVPPRRNWLTGHRDDPDGTCPRCATPLHHGRVGGRGTVWCPHCQPAARG
ncbi:Fpg/Nei family DNA glycosylase [Actinophytocola oryzae]|uniref:DNA-(Apurinic or apyrimidinic site) lyase /formamidopyrimidine-DNA glycosylase n=1 Tax=Actinophytocola oryzae TaxID=502181 RepID=A0A4V3FRC9_9PSEU|nr:DNA-formamidopyrimidine glycosylase family protein [Actinophytocola oryzae]TDV43091.1 DNA-(apurinic or apyrimidinic site) lyase /formamidopyrimidine-DNA glycosylase [Actinophytocola oryzae]